MNVLALKVTKETDSTKPLNGYVVIVASSLKESNLVSDNDASLIGFGNKQHQHFILIFFIHYNPEFCILQIHYDWQIIAIIKYESRLAIILLITSAHIEDRREPLLAFAKSRQSLNCPPILYINIYVSFG